MCETISDLLIWELEKLMVHAWYLRIDSAVIHLIERFAAEACRRPSARRLLGWLEDRDRHAKELPCQPPSA